MLTTSMIDAGMAQWDQRHSKVGFEEFKNDQKCIGIYLQSTYHI